MKRDIRIEVTYPYSPARVWRALTDSAELAQWLMPNDFQPRLGHKFQFRTKPQPGWRGVVDCEVTELDEARRLTYTWTGEPDKRGTKVTWTLEPVEGGTKLRLEHTGFEGLGGLLLTFIMGPGWGKMLHKGIPAVLAGGGDRAAECHSRPPEWFGRLVGALRRRNI